MLFFPLPRGDYLSWRRRTHLPGRAGRGLLPLGRQCRAIRKKSTSIDWVSMIKRFALPVPAMRKT